MVEDNAQRGEPPQGVEPRQPASPRGTYGRGHWLDVTVPASVRIAPAGVQTVAGIVIDSEWYCLIVIVWRDVPGKAAGGISTGGCGPGA